MKTDRELLELAAEAAGIECIEYVAESYPSRAGILHGNPNGRLFVWNPLLDDGEALRMAVKLNIDITQDTDENCEKVEAHFGVNDEWLGQPWSNDKYAATRRAIVRAAAAIAEQEK